MRVLSKTPPQYKINTVKSDLNDTFSYHTQYITYESTVIPTRNTRSLSLFVTLDNGIRGALKHQ